MVRRAVSWLGGAVFAAVDGSGGVDEAGVGLGQVVLGGGRGVVGRVEVEPVEDRLVEVLAGFVRGGAVQLAGVVEEFERGVQGGAAGFEVGDGVVELM
ncbi:MAG: hypothetical protein ACRDRH_17410 [Pseudonocardia sp.]